MPSVFATAAAASFSLSTSALTSISALARSDFVSASNHSQADIARHVGFNLI